MKIYGMPFYFYFTRVLNLCACDMRSSVPTSVIWTFFLIFNKQSFRTYILAFSRFPCGIINKEINHALTTNTNIKHCTDKQATETRSMHKIMRLLFINMICPLHNISFKTFWNLNLIHFHHAYERINIKYEEIYSGIHPKRGVGVTNPKVTYNISFLYI